MEKLRKPLFAALALAMASLLASCASSPPMAMESQARLASASPTENRLLIRTGEITLSVEDPSATLRAVEEIITTSQGFVERSTSEESSVWLTCRIPADSLDATMDQIAGLGKRVRRSVSASDVTDQHADLLARLETSRQLRDRMRDLLERASDVKDLLAIEKELGRLQAEIEMMEAQLERLDSQVALSSLTVRLEQKRILGPLGFVGYWTGWALSKLFVIR